MRYDAPLIAGRLVYGNPGLGVLGSVIRANTATGDNGPGILYNDWDSAADDNKAFRALILSGAPAGTFFDEDGSFVIPAGTADGTYTVNYELFVDGADLGPSTATITIGGTDFSVAPPGLPSTLAYGAAAASFTGGGSFAIAVAGIASSLSLGSPTASFAMPTSFTAAPAGLASTLALGATAVSFVVPDSGEPVTLAEAKLAARVDGDELDPIITGLITAAREQAEHITGRLYRQTVVRRELADWPDATAACPVHDATACAITYWDGTGWVPLDAAAYDFAPGGIGNNGTSIAPASGTSWPTLGDRAVGPRVRVDLTAGPASAADVPEKVKLYIKASVAAWLKAPEALVSGTLAPNPLYTRLLDAERLWGF